MRASYSVLLEPWKSVNELEVKGRDIVFVYYELDGPADYMLVGCLIRMAPGWDDSCIGGCIGGYHL